MTESELLQLVQQFVDCKYRVTADNRQHKMGLAYVTAERQDLAWEIARLIAGAFPELGFSIGEIPRPQV